MHYLYILRSQSQPDQTYTGATTDLRNRLADHNAGRSPHTSKFRPWALAYCSAFPDKQIALDFEAYLKPHSRRAFAKKRFLGPQGFSDKETAPA